MHMVRDEVLESEPDIEDIDSTLEQIDDRLVNIDEIFRRKLLQQKKTVVEVTARRSRAGRA